jgi:type II secretory pathway component PulF
MPAIVIIILLCIAVGVVLLAAVCRYFETERHSLLWVLMAAAERGIPLDAAARAFADERNDYVGRRARALADYLEAGLPLGLALQRSGHRVPAAALLAADLGSQTGTLGPALRQVVGQFDDLDMALRAILEKFFYLVCLVLVAIAVVSFQMLKIVPIWVKIMEEFQMALPRATLALIEISAFAVNVVPLLVPLLVLVLIAVVVAVLYYVRLSPRDLPMARRLWRRVDCALIMRWLAIAVRQKRSLAEMVRLLAAYYPQTALRRRLEQAAVLMGAGADWCDSLYRAGLIRQAECAVFQAAERAGNLAWALDEMADSSVRRLAYRLQRWLSILFPLVVLAFGACVFFIAFSLLVPLFSIIQHLA